MPEDVLLSPGPREGSNRQTQDSTLTELWQGKLTENKHANMQHNVE